MGGSSPSLKESMPKTDSNSAGVILDGSSLVLETGNARLLSVLK